MKFSAQKKKTEINLLPKSGFSSTTSGRLLGWLLSTFRVIVIVTEILVMVAFLSRFWLDAQNSDLNEQLRQKQSLLQASLSFENDLLDIQKRIETYEEYTQYQNPHSNALRYIAQSLPPDVLLVNLELDKNSVSVQGLTPNERSIQQFLSNLQFDDRFTNIHINGLKTDERQIELILFDIEAERIRS